jgi:hypothetical protein
VFSSQPAPAAIVRVRPIGLPQAGHKGFELRTLQSIRDVITSSAACAVMTVTIERDFCGGWPYPVSRDIAWAGCGYWSVNQSARG